MGFCLCEFLEFFHSGVIIYSIYIASFLSKERKKKKGHGIALWEVGWIWKDLGEKKP